ncbi:MAG: ribonuclease PH [bacterium JZ-2024 1]
MWLRSDGRGPEGLRPIQFHLNYLKYAEGSVLIEMGETRVLCSATVEESVPPFLKGTGEGWITAEYGMLPRSTITRKSRDVVRGKQDGRSVEIQRFLGRCLRSVVDRKALGERTIILDADVLQADGGTRTAAVTGSFLALVLAVRWLRSNQIITTPQPVIQDWLAAVSVGIVSGRMLLDLTYEEDSEAEVDGNIAMTASGEVADIQITGERRVITLEELQGLILLARKGINLLVEKQKQALSLSRLP